MGVIVAKYPGRCATCKRNIVAGQLIRAEKGKPPKHETCPPVLAATDKTKLHHAEILSAWVRRNPEPSLEGFAARAGGPAEPSFEDCFTDEETRWVQMKHREQITKWLAAHPETAAAYEAAHAAWKEAHAKVGKLLEKRRAS